jgi:type II secretory pathway predicted ATPase ExeA
LSHRTLEYRARLVGRTLEEAYKDNRRVVVLIDEAHLLRPDALLALKRLYEFEIGFKKLLSIILIGQDGLARQLRTNFNLTEVSQRVDLYEIGSLNGSLGAYVRHKLERAGAGRDIFDNSAFKAIGERHDTPLLVNNIAAAALVAAHDLGEKHVTGDIVRSIQGS